MQQSEAKLPGRQGAARRGIPGSGPAFDALRYDPSQWARAGRVAKELFQEAGEHLQVRAAAPGAPWQEPLPRPAAGLGAWSLIMQKR
jgi:hypothetical protein